MEPHPSATRVSAWPRPWKLCLVRALGGWRGLAKTWTAKRARVRQSPARIKQGSDCSDRVIICHVVSNDAKRINTHPRPAGSRAQWSSKRQQQVLVLVCVRYRIMTSGNMTHAGTERHDNYAVHRIRSHKVHRGREQQRGKKKKSHRWTRKRCGAASVYTHTRDSLGSKYYSCSEHVGTSHRRPAPCYSSSSKNSNRPSQC